MQSFCYKSEPVRIKGKERMLRVAQVLVVLAFLNIMFSAVAVFNGSLIAIKISAVVGLVMLVGLAGIAGFVPWKVDFKIKSVGAGVKIQYEDLIQGKTVKYVFTSLEGVSISSSSIKVQGVLDTGESCKLSCSCRFKDFEQLEKDLTNFKNSGGKK